MASSGSTKDLTRAINTFMLNASLPLPVDLVHIIEAYLEKHIDDGPSERLHEELISIWEKHVQDNPESHAPWLGILRRLLPALRDPVYLTEWWDRVQEPVLDNLADDKSLANEAWANTIAVLTCDDVEDPALSEGLTQLAIRLLRIWMQNVLVASQDGSSSQLLKAKLGLLAALDSFIVQKDYRAPALTLLCEFIQSQPPHLHKVLETSVFDHILKCLEHDSSTTVVTLAVTALTMILPNVPRSLVPYLPRLFNLYARLLFWDRERSLAAENAGLEIDADESDPCPGWERVSFSPDIDTTSIPNLLSYFTILYGLYPINFVEYIRKPQRYLRHAGDPNADNIEVQPSEIRQKSERFRQYHILHPNFYTLTLESEKTDSSRWIKSEASENVAECTALSLATDFGAGPDVGLHHDLGLSDMEEDVKRKPGQPFLTRKAIVEGCSRDQSCKDSTNGGSSEDPRPHLAVLRRSSQSSHAPSTRDAFLSRNRDGPGDSPNLPASVILSASHTNLQELILSNHLIKSGLHEMTNDSVLSLALSHQDERDPPGKPPITAPTAVSPSPAENGNNKIAQLSNRILLLSNDLTFERYMKQQHMAHIGELKKRQLREAATEAETQNIIMINRNLRNRLGEAKRSELRAKKESDNRRNLSKKWESDLSAKLKILREEQRRWGSEGAALRRELEVKTQECEKLTRMLCEYETTDVNAKQNQQAVEDLVEELSRLKAEVSRFVELERTHETKQQEAEARLNEAAESISHAEMLGMKLTARDTELQQAKELYESQIAELQAKLQAALHSGAAQLERKGEVSQAVESSLAASRAKMADLQRRYDMLRRKYSNLQSSLLDMKSDAKNQATIVSTRSGITSDSSDVENSAKVQGGSDSPSPVRRRSRVRGVSDPEHFVEGATYNVTPPLEASASSSFHTLMRRPSTPGSGAADSSSGLDWSPTERFRGRGGVQNSGKEKKDKKSSGIRSIRGFV